MPFNLLELSIFNGRPIELYEFYVLGQYWRYTNAEVTVPHAGADYVPMPGIKRSGIRATQSVERNELTVRVRGDSDLALEYLQSPPSEQVRIRIYQKHRDDAEFIVRYNGRVQNCSWSENGAVAEIQCAQVSWSLRQPGLRRSFQYSCPYPVFENGCGLSRAAYEVATTVTAMSGTRVTLAYSSVAYAANYFAGGYAQWVLPNGRRDRRMITGSAENRIVLHSTNLGLSVGDSVSLYPGCDHQSSTCYTKFDNVENFGGFPFIPDQSPFSGTTIF